MVRILAGTIKHLVNDFLINTSVYLDKCQIILLISAF